ncbi:MAG TPA: AAA family ATPase [Nitrospirales bacterium]|nr:hypothetical protein [Nitrospiraceae bacterium]HNP27903.1 AAA family ATPase [Nitrospirales bacterium]
MSILYETKNLNQLEDIPISLRELPQWVCWRLQERGGKLTKVPYSPKHPHSCADTTDPATWGTFEQACLACQQHKFSGVGFVFSKDDPYCGVDLDKCRDPQTGMLEPWAQEIVHMLNSYTEVSPSGTGVHIITRGSIPGPRNRTGHFEMYEKGRFFCMTGNHIVGAPKTIEPGQSRINAVYKKIFTEGEPTTNPSTGNGNGNGTKRESSSHEDQSILQKAMGARNGVAFSRLWQGDHGAYPSQSEADQALANHLNFYCEGDPVQIDRLFRQSGLYREKWDKQHGEKTYGEMTIAKALASGGSYYCGPQQKHGIPQREKSTEATGKPKANETPTRRLELIRADSIIMERTDWLWAGRVPRREITAFIGDPEVGKTMLALDIAAKGTTGTLEGIYKDKPFDVAIASAEDSPSHTMVPRLKAAGADLAKVHFIKMRIGKDDGGGLMLPDDLELLTKEVKRVGAKLLIIDPLMSHLGDGLNSNKDQDIRRALAPLSTLGADCDATILIICHLNKNESASSKYRIGGSVGIFAVPRSVLLAGEDPEIEGGCVLIHLKCNVGQKAEAVRYAIIQKLVKAEDGTMIDTGLVEWGGTAEGVTAESVLHNAKDPEQTSILDEASKWLESYLGDLTLSVKEVFAEGRKLGFSEITIRRAKKQLGVKSLKRGTGKDQVWSWVNPTPQADTPTKLVKGDQKPSKGDQSQNVDHLKASTRNKSNISNDLLKGDQSSDIDHLSKGVDHLSKAPKTGVKYDVAPTDWPDTSGSIDCEVDLC